MIKNGGTSHVCLKVRISFIYLMETTKSGLLAKQRGSFFPESLKLFVPFIKKEKHPNYSGKIYK